MEILAMLVPLVLLWIGFSTLRGGRSFTPANATGILISILMKILRWLWKEPPRGGGGRSNQPGIKYYDD